MGFDARDAQCSETRLAGLAAVGNGIGRSAVFTALLVSASVYEQQVASSISSDRAARPSLIDYMVAKPPSEFLIIAAPRMTGLGAACMAHSLKASCLPLKTSCSFAGKVYWNNGKAIRSTNSQTIIATKGAISCFDTN
jgi:hypothetical protein